MALFAIIAPSGSDVLTAAVQRAFPDDYFVIAPGQFAVSVSDGTTQEVAQRVGVKGEVGHFMVFPLSNWWGWHRKDVWEWLSARAKA